MTLPRSQDPPPLPDPSDRVRAFDALFRANYAGLCRFAGRILGSPAAAEEVVQDLFLYIWERHEVIDASTPSRAYLYRAAHNAAVNRLRRRRVESRWAEKQAATEAAPVTADEDMGLEELSLAVARAIERLPERTRLVYTMSRQNGLSYQEIASALGLSIKTVEGQMARAFRLLRAALAPLR
jgi:RNA polymerase sigma-70 factor, ECF subfamily